MRRRVKDPIATDARAAAARPGRVPSHAAALGELDHVVLPDAAIGERHHEHLTRATDALPAGCPGQVLVAVPAWLLSRISDELEDLSRPGRDLTVGPDDARNLIMACHVPIHSARRGNRPAKRAADCALAQALAAKGRGQADPPRSVSFPRGL